MPCARREPEPIGLIVSGSCRLRSATGCGIAGLEGEQSHHRQRPTDAHPRTGAELWAGELPFSAMATPMTYAIGGRQYVVVAAGGHPVLGLPVGDALVAFALPGDPPKPSAPSTAAPLSSGR